MRRFANNVDSSAVSDESAAIMSPEVFENRRGRVPILQQPQGGFNDNMLSRWDRRYVKRVAVLKRNEQCTRRPNALGDFSQELDRHR